MIKLNQGLLSSLIIVSLWACEKHNGLYQGEATGKEKMTDLVIPADFDWKTSDVTECVLIPATHPSRIEIYDDIACNVRDRIASLYVDEESEPVNIQVARTQKEVYARYMNEAGEFVVCTMPVNNGRISFQIPENSQNFSASEVPSKGDNKKDSREFESKGTILFEDAYPLKGDYDFNDYVIAYEFKAHTDKHNKLLRLDVELKFVAKGGLLSYIPYLRLKGIKTQHVRKMEKDDDTTQGMDIVLYDSEGSDQDVILGLTGVPEAMKAIQMEGSSYVNTEKEFVNKDEDDFPELEFTLYFNGNDLNKYDGRDIYDIFLRGEVNGQFTEIHLREFGSTRLTVGEKVPEGGYCTTDNFVWAMKVNKKYYDDELVGDYEVFPYLYEKVDFLKGYPDFKLFLTDPDTKWYTKSQRNDEHLIFFKD